VPNVIFLEGVTMRSTPLELTGYYGGADQYVGSMRIHILLRHELVDHPGR
jgi:predicted GH43/DUF377 family glycosyl hydrolase